MIERRLHDVIESQLASSSAVALLGPRQVGKTTLAYAFTESHNAVYLDLESPRSLAQIKDIEQFCDLNRGRLIILDEVQRVPELFQPLRSIIDQRRREGNKYGQFLLLGSASLDLLQQASESLAGRISHTELFPISVNETPNDATISLWLRGGFPDSFLADNDNRSLQWRQDFIRSYLERDVPMFGPRIPAETLRRLWVMLAHNQGTTLNASQLARALDVSSVTVNRYLDLLVDLLLVRRLSAWHSNNGKRLVKSPKVYVRDSGVTHALLDIENINQLLSHPVAGGSWEGFVIENIIQALPQGALYSHYRSKGGAEIDLVIEFPNQDIWAVEIKRSSAPKLSKGFYIACEDLQPRKRIVIHGGSDTFPMENNVMAYGLTGFVNTL